MIALRAATVLGAAILFLLAACGGPREQIVGKWRAQGESTTEWDFANNGVVQMGRVSGRYTFGDHGRMKIRTPTATFVYEVKIQDNTMIWKEPNGKRTELQRVP